MSFDYSGTRWGSSKAGLAFIYLPALKLRWCLEDLKEVKGRVLEVGCGAGGMAKAIKRYRPDLEIIGGDVSKEAIKYANKDSQGVKFIQLDAYNLPFKQGSLGAVVSFDVLEHLDKVKVGLKEVDRVLKPKGVFHNFLPLEGQKGTWYWLLTKLGWKGKKLAGHVRAYDVKQIVNKLEKNGFKVVRKKYGYHWFFQAIDLLHYASWSWLKTRPAKRSWFGVFKMIVAPLVNLESWLLAKVPGGGVSLGAVKK